MDENEKYQVGNNKNSDNTVQKAADIAEHIPVASKYAKAFKTADKLTGGKLGNKANDFINNNPRTMNTLNRFNNFRNSKKKNNEADNSSIDNDMNSQSEESNNQETPKKNILPKINKEDLGNSIKKKITGKMSLKTKIIILAGAAFLLLTLLLIIGLVGATDSEGGEELSGDFLDPYYNYTYTTVYLTNHYQREKNKIIYDHTGIAEFVLGALYANVYDQIKDNDEKIKAYMILAQSVALSNGYKADEKQVEVESTDLGVRYCDVYNGCNIYNIDGVNTYIKTNYEETVDGTFVDSIDAIDANERKRLYELYESIKYLILIDDKVDEAIDSYDSTTPDFDDDVIQQIFNSTETSYSSILKSIDNFKGYQIYNIVDYAMVYRQTNNNSAYWWPIGSAEPTSGNIYGGDPTTLFISSYFGMRIIEGKVSNHKGIDIATGSTSNNCGQTNIIASRSGTVIAASDTCATVGYYGNSCGGQLGNYVKIEDDDGIVIIYAHLKSGSVSVSVNSKVQQGQKIGEMGSSGSSTGCHLHFEIQKNGKAVNPLGDGYVDPENPRPVATFTGDGKESLCLNLKTAGFDNAAVAAVMSNVQAESASTFNPQIVEYRCTYNYEAYTNAVDNGSKSRSTFISDQCGYGLIQWTYYARKAGLYDYAKEKGTSIGDFNMQYEYFMIELTASSTYKKLLSNDSAYNKGVYFCRNFENPAGSCYTRMDNYLNAMITYVNNGCK